MKGNMIVALVMALAVILVDCSESRTSICRDLNETCQNNSQCCRNLYCRRSGLGNIRRCVRNGGNNGNCAGVNEVCSSLRRCCVGRCSLGRCRL